MSISLSSFNKLAAAVACFATLCVSQSITPQPAQAGSHANCVNYGRIAVQQQRRNLANRCGYAGLEWHLNEGAHYTWCRVASGGARRAGIANRRAALNRCIGRNPGGNAGRFPPFGNAQLNRACRNYAQKAVNQNRANRLSRCGYVGRRWSASFNRHFQWCRTASRNSRNFETRTRARMLNRCRIGAAPRPLPLPPAGNAGNAREAACSAYASNALAQFSRAKRLRCGFRGKRWHANYAQHKNWCKRVSVNARRSEQRARSRGLSQCAAANRQQQQNARQANQALCQRYARRAVNMYLANKRCQPRSPRWHSGYSSHYNWCMTASLNQRHREDRIRHQQACTRR